MQLQILRAAEPGHLTHDPPGACHRIEEITTAGRIRRMDFYPVDIEFRQSRHTYECSSTGLRKSSSPEDEATEGITVVRKLLILKR